MPGLGVMDGYGCGKQDGSVHEVAPSEGEMFTHIFLIIVLSPSVVSPSVSIHPFICQQA